MFGTHSDRAGKRQLSAERIGESDGNRPESDGESDGIGRARGEMDRDDTHQPGYPSRSPAV